MALNWNIEKVKNFEELQEGEAWRITDLLIWATMAAGMGEITKDNYKEFYARLHLAELLGGTYMMKDGKPVYFTLEDVKRRIGLTTNVSTITRPQFIKLKVGRYFDEIVK